MNTRTTQLAHVLQRELSEIIVRHLHEDKFGLITLTEVIVTKKMEEARIYITASAHPIEAVDYLNKNRPTFVKHLKHLILVRKIPKLNFVQDTRPEYAAKIEFLLDQQDTKQSPDSNP